MKHATAILIFLVLAVAVVSVLMAEPVLFLAGLIVIPALMQGVPWGLAQNQEEPPEDEYNESNAGFLSDLKQTDPA